MIKAQIQNGGGLVSYLVVDPEGVLQEPVLLLLDPVRLKRFLTDFTRLHEERGLFY